MFNHQGFVKEFADLASLPEVKTALEVGCFSGELTNALAEKGLEVEGISLESTAKDVVIADILTFESEKTYDLVFSSGLLEHFDKKQMVQVIQNMAKISNKYVLNFVPNSNCLAYIKAKGRTTAPWKNELDFTKESLAELHVQSGLNVIKTGFAGAEWTKLFGPEPSEPYLVWVLAEKVLAEKKEEGQNESKSKAKISKNKEKQADEGKPADLEE